MAEMNFGQALALVKQVTAQIYGFGDNEGRKGGAGSVGLINGKPVKFNTHWKERYFSKTTAEMIKSSNDLRESLGAAARALKNRGKGGVYEKTYRRICKTLGLNSDGKATSKKSLLSRKVAAKVVDDMMLMGNRFALNLWEGALDAGSSTGVDTHFSASKARTQVTEHLKTSLTGFGKLMTLQLDDEKEKIEGSLQKLTGLINGTVKRNEVENVVLHRDGTTIKYLCDENTNRRQDLQLGEVVYNCLIGEKTDEVIEERRANIAKGVEAVFTRNGKVDETARKFFLEMLQNGVNYADNDRITYGQNGETMTFPYHFTYHETRGSFTETKQSIFVTVGDKGTYRAEFFHKGSGVKFFDRYDANGTATRFKSDRKKPDMADTYSYWVAVEFSVDDNGKIKAWLPEAPRVKWNIGNHFSQSDEKVE